MPLIIANYPRQVHTTASNGYLYIFINKRLILFESGSSMLLPLRLKGRELLEAKVVRLWVGVFKRDEVEE